MPKAIPREPTRVQRTAEAIAHLDTAAAQLHAINLRHLGNGPLKDAIRKAREDTAGARATLLNALRLESETLGH